MSNGRLLFKSCFEPDTKIAPYLTTICGLDHHTGYSWDDQPGWIAQRRFVTCVWEAMDLRDFVDAEITSQPGPDGRSIRGLHLENKHPSPSHAYGTAPVSAPSIRIEYQLRGRAVPDEFQEGFVRYHMKLQDNLDQIVPLHTQPGWYMIMEWKEISSGRSGPRGGVNNYRINIGIGKDSGKNTLHWEIMAQQVQPERRTEWIYCNRTVPVPLGRWFLVETYLRKHPTSGRIFFAVDGQVVIDKVCRTQHATRPLPLDFWSIFKHYHAEDWYALGPTHQWYCNVEVWDGFPVDPPQ